MKKVSIVLISMLVLAQSVFAENRVSFVPKEATVYLSGAKLTGVSSVDLPAGNSEVVFEKLSPNVYAPSLQIKVNGNAKVLSAQFRTHYPEQPNVEAPIKILQDSINLIQDENSYFSGKIGVYEAEKQLINGHYGKVGSPVQGNTVIQINPNDFKDLDEYYRNRMMDILDKVRDLNKNLKKNNLLIERLQQKIYNLAPKALPTEGEIVVQLNSPVAQRIELTCIYLINQAGWTPLYDIATEGTDKPVKLTYKASIYQSSGLDWKNVKLHVSTANPFTNNSRPILNPLYINYQVVSYYDRQRDNVYSLNSAAATNMMQVKAEEAEKKDMSRAAAPAGITMPVEDLLPPPNTTEAAQIEMDIPFNQTIPATGIAQVIEMETYNIKANYMYHCVPKIDPGVFLLAKITDYGQYNLMPGLANIFYQNTLIGQSQIDPKTVSDTLLLSFGKDENISVKRLKAVDVTGAKVIGTNKKESLAFEITIKNNKQIPINIEILDQLPISRQTDIVVEPDDLGGAEYTKDYGKLLWRQTIGANSSKKLRFSYSIKYPKEKVVMFQN